MRIPFLGGIDLPELLILAIAVAIAIVVVVIVVASTASNKDSSKARVVKVSNTNQKNKERVMIEELKQLKELLDMGAITQEEFDAKKEQILSQPIECAQSAQAQDTASAGEKSKLVAGLLAIFLGTLGIHKFYLGYTQAGVIMLLVSILGAFLFGLGPLVMGVIALIEGIMYLTKSDADFERIYVIGNKPWF